MESFAGKISVVTGGGSGMGRELVRQLAAEGCSVATCDVHANAVAETADLAGTRPSRILNRAARRPPIPKFRGYEKFPLKINGKFR